MKPNAFKWAKIGATLLGIALLTFFAHRIYDTQKGSPLEPWHTYVPEAMIAALVVAVLMLVIEFFCQQWRSQMTPALFCASVAMGRCGKLSLLFLSLSRSLDTRRVISIFNVHRCPSRKSCCKQDNGKDN